MSDPSYATLPSLVADSVSGRIQVEVENGATRLFAIGTVMNAAMSELSSGLTSEIAESAAADLKAAASELEYASLVATAAAMALAEYELHGGQEAFRSAIVDGCGADAAAFDSKMAEAVDQPARVKAAAAIVGYVLMDQLPVYEVFAKSADANLNVLSALVQIDQAKNLLITSYATVVAAIDEVVLIGSA